MCEGSGNAGWMFVRSVLFFDHLRQVFRTLSRGQHSKCLRDFIGSRWGIGAGPAAFDGSNREIEALRAKDRHLLLSLASHVLEGWPWDQPAPNRASGNLGTVTENHLCLTASSGC